MKVSPDELDTTDGYVYLKAMPENRLPWKAMSVDRTITGYGRFEPDYSLTNCMVSFVEVEVDTETGKVDLIYVVNATDVGRIIDPLGIENQLNGSLGSGGIDSAIFEETALDRKRGLILNANLVDYKWRTFLELPEIRNVILETPMPTHRFEAVGIGEIATSPGPSAVLMAASNALGRWVHHYPLTPERVLAVLERRED
jgi:xanthine dehydrogenase molybdenum-binding subunit